MIIFNAELHWVKLGDKVDMGFDGNSPSWIVEMRTRDKEEGASWKAQNLNVKTKDDNDGIFWSASVKKPTTAKNGKEQTSPPVVGKDKFPFENVEGIGNGTIANVKIHQFDYDYNGKKGVGSRLEAIQVVDLVEYEGGSVTDGFPDF